MKRRLRLGAIPVLGLVAIIAWPLGATALGRARGAWQQIAPIPADVTINAITGGDDFMLYAFGVCESRCVQSNGTVGAGKPVTYIWDGQWIPGRGAPRACDGAKAAVMDSRYRIRLAGCWSDMYLDPGFRIAVYNPVFDTWRLQASYGPYVDPIAGLRDASGRVLWYSNTLRRSGGAVLISGQRIVESINGTWYLRTREPSGGPSDGAAIGNNGRVFAVGGERTCFPQFGTCPVPRLAAWSRRTNAWTRPTELPTPRIRVAVASDGLGRIFAVGGLTPDGAETLATVDVYDPQAGQWLAARRLPEPRFEALATSTPDGRVFVLGGYDAQGSPLTDGYVFYPR